MKPARTGSFLTATCIIRSRRTGEYGNTDYPYLTYDDLFKLQKYLSDRFSRTDPVLDMLMQHKRAWMDANGITAYMK